MKVNKICDLFLNRRFAVIFLLGFASGLPLSLTSNSLQAWYTYSGVNIVTIGFLGLAGLPYIFKFIWAPVLDRYIPPFLGRRRGWMLINQLSLLLAIALMAVFSPNEQPTLLGMLALMVAFLSATQDIAIDAYRADILKPNERGFGAACGVAGYRLAMLISGGFAFIIADYIGWDNTYLIMACLMSIGIFATFFGKEPELHVKTPTTLISAVIDPLREFLGRENAFIFLLLILLYKLGDAFVLSMSTPFLLRGLNFSLTEVGILNKGVGFIAILMGVFTGGFLMVRVGQFKSLFLFGLLQTLSNLVYMLLAIVGKNMLMAAGAIFFENLAAGMCSAVFIAFLMSLCDHRFTAFQYALLSAIAAVGRVIVGPISGLMVDWTGWVNFFFFAFVMTLPGLLLLWYLRNHIGVSKNYAIGDHNL